MALIKSETVMAKNKAGGKGEIYITHLLLLSTPPTFLFERRRHLIVSMQASCLQAP